MYRRDLPAWERLYQDVLLTETLHPSQRLGELHLRRSPTRQFVFSSCSSWLVFTMKVATLAGSEPRSLSNMSPKSTPTATPKSGDLVGSVIGDNQRDTVSLLVSYLAMLALCLIRSAFEYTAAGRTLSPGCSERSQLVCHWSFRPRACSIYRMETICICQSSFARK